MGPKTRRSLAPRTRPQLAAGMRYAAPAVAATLWMKRRRESPLFMVVLRVGRLGVSGSAHDGLEALGLAQGGDLAEVPAFVPGELEHAVDGVGHEAAGFLGERNGQVRVARGLEPVNDGRTVGVEGLLDLRDGWIGLRVVHRLGARAEELVPAVGVGDTFDAKDAADPRVGEGDVAEDPGGVVVAGRCLPGVLGLGVVLEQVGGDLAGELEDSVGVLARGHGVSLSSAPLEASQAYRASLAAEALIRGCRAGGRRGRGLPRSRP